MNTQTNSNAFPLGQIIISGTARAQLHPDDVTDAIDRHARGDWGDFARPGAAPTKVDTRDGFRLVSAYRDRHGTRFFVVTEADRRVTAVFLSTDSLAREGSL